MLGDDPAFLGNDDPTSMGNDYATADAQAQCASKDWPAIIKNGIVLCIDCHF